MVKYSSNIELYKELNVYKSIKGFADEGDRVTVFNRYVIKSLVIYVNTDTALRLLSEKDRGGY